MALEYLYMTFVHVVFNRRIDLSYRNVLITSQIIKKLHFISLFVQESHA